MTSPFGPVFHYEMLRASRRWQLFAGRALLVGGLLAGLFTVWANRFRYHAPTSYQQLAELGQAFFQAIMWVELTLTIFAVPAATAGAVCVDKMRGGLLLTLATDLTAAEIVYGKLASRLTAVLGVLACGTPVLAMTSWMGGIDPWDAVGGTLVIAGLAVLVVTLTVTFSVWATRPNDALMATYAALALWLLMLPLWVWFYPLPPSGFIGSLLVTTHPIVLVLGNVDNFSRWIAPIFWLQIANFTASLLVSLGLASLCVGRIRDVTVSQAGRPQARRRRRRLVPGRFVPGRFVPSVSMDDNPLLWREWYHSTTSGMANKVWRLYAGLSVLYAVTAVLTSSNSSGAALGGGIIVAIGLLFVTTTAATRLAEERAHGSLEVLLATPLSSREIVLGKWWGAFRDVPGLAALAGAMGLGMHLQSQHSPLDAVPFAASLAALVLAYGGVAVGVGLASAVRQPQLGRAIGLAVTAYLAATLVYPFAMILLLHAGPSDVALLWPSPLFGVFMHLDRAGGRWSDPSLSTAFRTAFLASLTFLVAMFLRLNTVRSFGRRLGRIDDEREPSPATEHGVEVIKQE